jgi:hypothetical protein
VNDKKEKKDKTIDPYTGEEVPVAEDADKFVEVVPRETDERKGQKYLLEEETSMDALAADENADEVANLSASYTEDEEIEADFAERQQLAVGGRKVLEEELDEHHSESPKLSGGDLDANWQSANEAGEETVGGTAPTPDQDVVDELGEAVGLTYADDEPIQGEEKLGERDRNRWELNPESASEDEDESENPTEE